MYELVVDFSVTHTPTSPLYIPFLLASHGSQRAPGWSCCRLLLADEEGGRRWWGWVWMAGGKGRRGKPQSQKWCTGRALHLPAFYKPPGLSQGISLCFFKRRCGLVSNLVNHPVLRRWDSDPPGSQGHSLCFSLASLSTLTTLFYFPHRGNKWPPCLRTSTLSVSMFKTPTPNSPSNYQTFSPLNRRTWAIGITSLSQPDKF